MNAVQRCLIASQEKREQHFPYIKDLINIPIVIREVSQPEDQCQFVCFRGKTLWQRILNNSKKKILIEGNFGSGKPLILKKLMKEWHRKKMYEEEPQKCVFVVSIKKMRSNESLLDAMISQNSIRNMTNEKFKTFVDNNKSNIILILKKVREYNPRREDDIRQLIHEDIVDFYKVIIISVSWNAKEIRNPEIVFKIMAPCAYHFSNVFESILRKETIEVLTDDQYHRLTIEKENSVKLFLQHLGNKNPLMMNIGFRSIVIAFLGANISSIEEMIEMKNPLALFRKAAHKLLDLNYNDLQTFREVALRSNEINSTCKYQYQNLIYEKQTNSQNLRFAVFLLPGFEEYFAAEEIIFNRRDIFDIRNQEDPNRFNLWLKRVQEILKFIKYLDEKLYMEFCSNHEFVLDNFENIPETLRTMISQNNLNHLVLNDCRLDNFALIYTIFKAEQIETIELDHVDFIFSDLSIKQVENSSLNYLRIIKIHNGLTKVVLVQDLLKVLKGCLNLTQFEICFNLLLFNDNEPCENFDNDLNLTDLSIIDCSVGTKELEQIANIIRFCPLLSTLNLSRNH